MRFRLSRSAGSPSSGDSPISGPDARRLSGGSADAGDTVWSALGIMWIPDATTLRRVFALLDAAAPDTALEVWAARASSPALGQRRRIAVNGRTLRGTRAGDTPGQYLLVTLDLTGTVVTADALHTQRDTATWLVARGARCFPTAKANQSTLHAQLTALT